MSKETERKLIRTLAQNLKAEHKHIDQVIDSIMKGVEVWAKSHKKEWADLTKEEQKLLTEPTYLVRRIAEIQYSKHVLTNVVYKNLRRVGGNLDEEQKVLALYDTLEQFKYKCPYSDTLLIGGETKIHLDHIIPVTLGGPTDDWNIIPVCDSCNISKSNRHLLDWWERNRGKNEEFKLVRIFEYMTSKLLANDGIKFITQLTDEEIEKAQKSEQQVIDGRDIENKRLDPITFLFQLYQHIEQNTEYILDPQIKFASEQEKMKAIESKLREMKFIFEKLYKKNKHNKAKTDLEFLNQQKEMVKYLKNLGIISHYQIAYNYFEELQGMINNRASEEEILAFCSDKDRFLNIEKFILDLKEFLAENEGRYPNTRSKDPKEKTLGYKVDSIRKNIKMENWKKTKLLN